jgi:hypothetical protein
LPWAGSKLAHSALQKIGLGLLFAVSAAWLDLVALSDILGLFKKPESIDIITQ